MLCTIHRNFAPIQYIFYMEDRHIDCNWAIVDVYCSARFSVRESIIFNIQSPEKNIKRCHRLYIHWFRFINHCHCFIIHCRRFNFCPALRRLLMAPFSCFRRGISDWKNVKNVKPCNVERELPYIKVYGAARDRPANH